MVSKHSLQTTADINTTNNLVDQENKLKFINKSYPAETS